jgi:hypothetical protein
MSALAAFDKVAVVPVTAVKSHIALGGPIWPDFYHQTAPRHCRNGRPVDRRPARTASLAPFRRPAIWGGYLDPAFGHLVAEQLTRLPLALADRPGDLVLFTLDPKRTPETLPGFVWELFDWLGVPRRALRFVTEPRLAPELRVAPQAEMLGGVAPAADYLDLLDHLPARNGLAPQPRLPLVYVGRAGLAAQGRGAHLGEAYLIALLERLGVTVIDPGRMPLRAQMHIYLQAEVLVFSEGSALHGRELLGRIAQDIHVLMRRPGSALARAQLTPRCRSLAYHDVVAQLLTVQAAPGGPAAPLRELGHLTASFYDIPALLRVFADLGLPLTRHWNMQGYRRAALDDALRWLLAQSSPLDQSIPNLIRILGQIASPEDLLDMTEPPAARPAASH